MNLSNPFNRSGKFASSYAQQLHIIKTYLVSERGVDLELIPENERLSVELLVHHHSHDAHHRRAAVVQLLGPQINLISLVSCPGPESDRELTGSEITNEGSLLLLKGRFQQANSHKNGEQISGTQFENGIFNNQG